MRAGLGPWGFVVADYEVALPVDGFGLAGAVDDLHVHAGELHRRLAADPDGDEFRVRKQAPQGFQFAAAEPSAPSFAFRARLAFLASCAFLAFCAQRRELEALLTAAVSGSEHSAAFAFRDADLHASGRRSDPSARNTTPASAVADTSTGATKRDIATPKVIRVADGLRYALRPRPAGPSRPAKRHPKTIGFAHASASCQLDTSPMSGRDWRCTGRGPARSAMQRLPLRPTPRSPGRRSTGRPRCALRGLGCPSMLRATTLPVGTAQFLYLDLTEGDRNGWRRNTLSGDLLRDLLRVCLYLRSDRTGLGA